MKTTAKKLALPCRGFALFAKAGEIEVRTVTITGLFALLNAASVTESVTGVTHVLSLDRVASETTLAAKKAAFAQTLSATRAERPQHTRPVMTARAA